MGELVIDGKEVCFGDVTTALQKRIGYKFKDIELLYEAFTHASYANEFRERSYERLEFLGDSILNFTVAMYFFKKFPDKDEGFLTQSRMAAVSEQALARASDAMGIMPYLRIAYSAGAEVRSSERVKGNLFESVTGAILMDGGVRPAEKFILSKLSAALSGESAAAGFVDYKSKLLEYAARRSKKVIFEECESERGTFAVTVLMGGKPYASGSGASKKKAEQNAAKETLEQLRQL